jgi:hypothetical protein
MSTTHTPPPWINDGAVRVQGAAPDAMYDIARVCPAPPHLVNGEAVRLANAVLIAHAPGLAAALGEVLEHVTLPMLESSPALAWAFREASAVLASATGDREPYSPPSVGAAARTP